jgi:hypothetical protein
MALTTPRSASARSEEASPRVVLGALSAQLDLERELLRKDRDRCKAAAQAREVATKKASALHAQLDALSAGADGAATLEAIEGRRRDAAAAEAARAGAVARCAEALGQIQQRLERILLIEQRIAALGVKAREEEASTLAGTWDVLLQPTREEGTFTLKQFGMVLSGQFQLEGPVTGLGRPAWKGTLQGTVLGDKTHLQRIDSKAGRSSELEGTLQPGGKVIRGTWQSASLADGAAASGTWAASRRED